MSKKLPVLKTSELLRILFKYGFQPRRKKGSHLILYKEKTILVVPIHKGKDIPRGTLENIIKQAGLEIEDIIKLI